MVNVNDDPKLPSGLSYWIQLLQAMQDIDMGVAMWLVKFVFFLKDKKLLKSGMLRLLAKAAYPDNEQESWKILHLFMEQSGMKPDGLKGMHIVSAALVTEETPKALPPAPPTGEAVYGKVEYVDGHPV